MTLEFLNETAVTNPRRKNVPGHFQAFRDTRPQWFRMAENSHDSFIHPMQAQERQQAARQRR